MEYRKSKHQQAWWLAMLLVVALLPSQVWAELHFSQLEVDAGEVRAGVPLSHRFALVNTGPEVVEITEVRAGCGCLKPRLEPRRYQPGAEGTLFLEVNTLSQPAGPHTFKVHIAYQSGNVATETSVQLTARVITEVTVQPAAVTVLADSAVGQDIVLTDSRPQPLRIVGVRSSSSHLNARAVGADGGVQTIHLEVTDEFSEGRHEETVGIFSSDPDYPEIRVPVTVLKRSRRRLSATPSQVDLTAPPGQPVPSRIVLIHDSGNQAVVLDQVTADDPAVTCQWARGPGEMATLKIIVDRRLMSGSALQTAVHVQVRQPIRQALTIPLNCTLP